MATKTAPKTAIDTIAENGGLIKVGIPEGSKQKESADKDSAKFAMKVIDPKYKFDDLIGVYECTGMMKKCVEFKAQNLVAAGWEVYPLDRKKVNEKEREELKEFFEHCNPDKTFEEIIAENYIDEETTGSSGIEVARDRLTGKPSQLFNLPISTVRVAKGGQDDDGIDFKTGQRFVQMEANIDKVATWYNKYTADEDDRTDATGFNPDLNEVLWFKKPNPSSRYYGLPPNVAIMTDLLLSKYASEYNKSEFENGMLSKFAIVVEDGQLKKESVEAIKAFVSEVMQTGKATSIPILMMKGKGKAKIERLTAEIKDMSYKDLMKHIDSKVWITYGVPPVLLGVPDSSFKNTAEEEERKFYEKEIIPEQNRRMARFNKMIREDFGYENWGVRLKTPNMDDIKAASEINERKTKMGAMTINEWREADGMVQIEGGDIPMIWTSIGLMPVSDLPSLAAGDFAESQAEKIGKVAMGQLLTYEKSLRAKLEKREIMLGTDEPDAQESDSPYPDGAHA